MPMSAMRSVLQPMHRCSMHLKEGQSVVGAATISQWSRPRELTQDAPYAGWQERRDRQALRGRQAEGGAAVCAAQHGGPRWSWHAGQQGRQWEGRERRPAQPEPAQEPEPPPGPGQAASPVGLLQRCVRR